MNKFRFKTKGRTLLQRSAQTNLEQDGRYDQRLLSLVASASETS
jgi:hypothetical protein